MKSIAKLDDISGLEPRAKRIRDQFEALQIAKAGKTAAEASEQTTAFYKTMIAEVKQWQEQLVKANEGNEQLLRIKNQNKLLSQQLDRLDTASAACAEPRSEPPFSWASLPCPNGCGLVMKMGLQVVPL